MRPLATSRCGATLAALAALATSTALAAPGDAKPEKAAAPELINLPETPAQLALETTWSPQELPQLPATSDAIGPARLVAFYREARAARPSADPPLALIVLRFDAPNPRAWRANQRAAYLDEIEASVLAACSTLAPPEVAADAPPAETETARDSAAIAPLVAECRGARRLKRSGFQSEAVPGMDLQLRDATGATRLFRFLFFRTYAIVAAVEVPPRARSSTIARARRALAGFTVEPNWQR